MRDLVSRLQQYGGDFVGALSFLKNYKYYAVSEDLYEMENTRHNSPGPYIGSETCHRAGTSFRKKYSSLYNSGGVLPVFIAASKRVYDSAVYFTKGFSQGSYSKEKFRYVVITESSAQGTIRSPQGATAQHLTMMPISLFLRRLLQSIDQTFKKIGQGPPRNRFKS